MTQKLLTNAKEICCKCFEYIGFISIGVIAVAVLGWIIHCIPLNCLQDPPRWLSGIRVALPFLVVLTAISFIIVFTRDLPGNGSADSSGDNKSLSPQLRNVFIYGYVFMLASLSFCAVLFVTPIGNFFGPSSDSSMSMSQFPAGIVLGCRSVDCTDTTDREPEWFLHVGSSVSKVTTRDANTDKNSQNEVRPANYQVLKGGLAVPLYVVFLALLGGAVSMIRRVPEYQRATTRRYKEKGDPKVGHDTGEEPTISAVRARELVIFQIMQMFTAPLIAVTAHAALRPDGIAVGGLLGFLSGFASETILLRLRKAADALSGQTK